MMTLSDIAIIYLSLSAPFGVYHFLHYRSVQRHRFLRAIIVFFTWPPFAFILFAKILFSSGSATLLKQQSDHENDLPSQVSLQIMRIRSGLDHLSRPTAASFKSSLERYAELSLILITENGNENGQFVDLLSVAGSPLAETGARCLIRRNHRIVERHHIAARDILAKATEEFGHGRNGFANEIIELARIVDDQELIARLQKRNGVMSDREAEGSKNKEYKWETSKGQKLGSIIRSDT
jgi:hypothetical protein